MDFITENYLVKVISKVHDKVGSEKVNSINIQSRGIFMQPFNLGFQESIDFQTLELAIIRYISY